MIALNRLCQIWHVAIFFVYQFARFKNLAAMEPPSHISYSAKCQPY